MSGWLCGPMGLTGWVVTWTVWTGLIALVVWTIARLFPERAAPGPPPAGVGPAPASRMGDQPESAEPTGGGRA
jgi:hypothetical protein